MVCIHKGKDPTTPPAVCEKTITPKTRERVCPKDVGQKNVNGVSYTPQWIIGDPDQILAGTVWNFDCNFQAYNKANPSQTKPGTNTSITVNWQPVSNPVPFPNGSPDGIDHTVMCSFDANWQRYDCDYKVKVFTPSCEVKATASPEKAPWWANIEVKMKPEFLKDSMEFFPRCDLTNSLVALIGQGGQATLSNIPWGNYDVTCGVLNKGDTTFASLFLCKGNFGITNGDPDSCKDKFKINWQAADQNNPLTIEWWKAELTCDGTLTINPPASDTIKWTLEGNTFKYSGVKKEFFAECKTSNNLSCFGKFNLSGTGWTWDVTETGGVLCGNSKIDAWEQCDGTLMWTCSASQTCKSCQCDWPPTNGTSNTVPEPTLSWVKCTVDPIPWPVIETPAPWTIGYICNGWTEVTSYNVDIVKQWGAQIATQLWQTANQTVTEPGIYNITCNVFGSWWKTDKCETQIEIKTKEPKCIIKWELVNAKERWEIKYTMQLDSAWLWVNDVEYICWLVNEADITESYAWQQLSSTYAGIRVGTYKVTCLVRKKGAADRVNAVKCEDWPFSITPNGLDDCKDKIQVTPGKKTSDTPPVTYTIDKAPATVSCGDWTLQKPTSPTLDFKWVSAYDIICKMPAWFTCSAKAVGTWGALDPHDNPSSWGNSNGNSGWGNGNGNGNWNNGSGGNGSWLNTSNTYDLAISKQITSEFMSVGSGVNFSITIHNEWAIGVSWVSIRDLVFGLTGLKIGKDLLALKNYVWNPSLDVVIAFPINLAAGASMTYYMQAIMTQSWFSNQAQVCDYDSVMDLDSDSCNGYTKGEDDDDIVWGNVYSGSVWDRVWMDSNENGKQDTWEVWVANIPVQLLRCWDNKLIATWITKTDGKYLFMGIDPGSYRLQASLSGTINLKFTKFKQGTSDIIDSDITPYSGGIGLSDCVSIVWWQNYLKLDAGLIPIPTDIQVTKKTTRKFVTDNDIVKWSLTLTNTGEWIITNYTLWDKIPGILSYKFISLSGVNNELIKCGYPIGRQYNNNTITWKVTNSYLKPWESCYFELTTQLAKNVSTGIYYNTACATGVNQEISWRLLNNCWTDSIQVIKACPNIQVSPDFWDNPMNSQFVCTLSGTNTGYIQILNSNDVLLKSYNTLSGYHLFSGNGYYYVECVSKQFSERCMRPVEVRELSECLALQVKDSNNNTVQTNASGYMISWGYFAVWNYNAYCSGYWAENYKIHLRQWTATWLIIQTITWQSGMFQVVQPGFYTMQCLVNNIVDYKFDYASQLPQWVDTSVNKCPYKVSLNGSICAVANNITPYKKTFIPLSEFKYSIDPIEYCDPAIVSTLSCNITNAEKTLIKNHQSCILPLLINQPDLQISKSWNKVYYDTSWKTDTILYTIAYQNIWGIAIKSAIIQDTLPEFISLSWLITFSNSTWFVLVPSYSWKALQWSLSGTLQANQSGTIQFTTKIQQDIKLPIKNKVLANSPWDKYLANNISEYTIYPVWWIVSWNSIGDRVRSDKDFNGIQNSWESWVSNIKLELLSCSWTQALDIVYSNSVWYYIFKDVSPGYYKVSAILQSGFVFTYGKVWTNDTIDSDITIGWKTNCFYFDGSWNNFNKDIWLYDIRSISWTSCNYNGIAEPSLWEECDIDDGVFGASERCIACTIHKLFPNCGDGIVQPWEGCDCSSNLPAGASCVDCQIATGSVCGNAKLEWLEECESNSAKVPGLQCISCKLVSNSMSQCGNNTLEAGEMCDLGAENGSNKLISWWRFAWKNCSNNCNIIDNACNITPKYTVPECSQVLSPNIMEWEFMPFWRDISNSQIINSSICQPGKIPYDSVFCSFSLYNGKLGTTQALTNFTIPCINPKTYDSPLLESRNGLSAKYIGRSYIQVADWITKGVYGEYKLQLNRIDYAVCATSGSLTQKTVQWASLINASSTWVICEYNFTVSRPYLMQVGNILSSNQTDKLSNFYGFNDGNKKQSILSQYWINLTPLTLNKFAPNATISYIINEFVNKQSKLAIRSIEYWPRTSRVPGSNVFIYEGNMTLDINTLPTNTTSTIIIKNWNLVLSGSIKNSNLYIVPDGTVTFSNWCNQNQEIYWVVISNKDLLSDIPYMNNNLLNKRCQEGWLTIYGTLVGKWIDTLISKRRSKLEGWFIKSDYWNKYQSIINGWAITIKSNPTFNTTPPPWWNDLSKSITTLKQ